MTSHHRPLGVLAISSSALALTACAPALTTSAPLCSETGLVAAPIVGGFASDAHPATVALLTYGQPTCTGTLVAPDLVLTAAHCIVEPPVLPTEIGLGSVGTFTERVAIVDAAVHEGYVSGVVQAGHDIALLRLARPVTSISPVTLYTGDARALVGRAATVVGYGESYPNARDAARREGRVVIGSVTEQTLVEYFAGTSICHGDSGGPAFVEMDGAHLQVGVTSFGDQYCMVEAHHQRLDVVRDWLREHGVPVDGEAPPACGADGVCDGTCAGDPDCAPTPCVLDEVCEQVCTADPDCTTADACPADGACDLRCGATDPDCADDGPGPTPTPGPPSCVQPDFARGVCVYYDASGNPSYTRPILCVPGACAC